MADWIDDRYEIGLLLGTGASSRVYAAFDHRLERTVALKVLHLDGLDASAEERFLREARIAAGLRHPNVISVFDAGESGGDIYIVMERVDGEDLASYLRAHGPLGRDRAVGIAAGVLGALGAAHAAGVVHRDVKPSNILLDEHGTARLGDFGIAKPMGELTQDLTATGTVLGTATYMSPEQVAGESLGPTSDLYSLGVVLYEMLAGVPPFRANTPIATALAHRTEPPPPLVDTVPQIDGPLAAAVGRALAKDPADRYADAAAMLVALEGSAAATIVFPASNASTDATAVMAAGTVTDVSASADSTTAMLAAGAVDVSASADRTTAMTSAGPVSDVGSPPPSGARRRWLMGAALAAAVALLVGIAVSGDGGSGDLAASLGSTTTSEASSTTETTAATTTTVPTAASSIAELIAVLEDDPNAYGKKGPDLLKRLEEIERDLEDEGTGGRSPREKGRIRDLVKNLDRWVGDGDLDSGIADQARELLEPLLD